MTAIDSASLNFWELVADWGTKIVIFGVAGEGIEIALKWFECKGKSECFKKWCEEHKFSLDVFWPGLFWMMVVVGLVMEFEGSRESQKIITKENTRITQESGQAIKEAADAKWRAALANERAAMVESNNWILRSNVMALEVKVKPRTITVEQEANLINILKPFVEKNSNGSNRVVVEYVLSDSDSDKYARRLYSILKECGFDVDLVGGVPLEPSPNITGLVLSVRDPLNAPPQADAILNALKAVGLTPSDPISSGHNPSVEPGTVEIMVGKRRIE